MTEASDDLTLDEIRAELAPRIAAAAAFDGWTKAAVCAAASEIGIDEDVAAYAFRGGQMDMIEAWIGQVDDAMEASLPAASLADVKVSERISRLIRFRLQAVAGLEESLRRALAIMAMPQNVSRALQLCWHSADRMWRLAGDTATDYNHYSKRTILAGIYAASLVVFVDDKSEGKEETLAFLERRIDGVMRFEKTKAQLVRPREDRFSLARFLGRLRYPAG